MWFYLITGVIAALPDILATNAGLSDYTYDIVKCGEKDGKIWAQLMAKRFKSDQKQPDSQA